MSALGEEGLWKRYLPSWRKRPGPGVVVGVGDDAAVLKWRGPLLVSTDMLVEGVHFDLAWTSGEDLGHKALAVNLSDIAAMGGADKIAAVVAAGVPPETPVKFLDGFHRGLGALARTHGCSIVGGDTVRADKLTLSLTVLAESKRWVLRGTARPEDGIYVTGTVGDAAAGLTIVQKTRRGAVPQAARKFLTRRLLRPSPRLDVAPLVARAASAMLDASDGLARSVELLCKASGLGAEVELERMPLSNAFRQWARSERDPLAAAWLGGEDYELVFTAGDERAAPLERRGLARRVGRITKHRSRIVVIENGRNREVRGGYEHFG